MPAGSSLDNASIGAGKAATINDLQSGSFRSIYTLANASVLQLDAYGLTL